MPKLHYFDYTFALQSHEFIPKKGLFTFPNTCSVAIAGSVLPLAAFM